MERYKKYCVEDFLTPVSEVEMSQAAILAKRLDELEARFGALLAKATEHFNRCLDETTKEFSRRTSEQTLLSEEIRRLVAETVHAKFEAEGNELGRAIMQSVMKRLGRGL